MISYVIFVGLDILNIEGYMISYVIFVGLYILNIKVHKEFKPIFERFEIQAVCMKFS